MLERVYRFNKLIVQIGPREFPTALEENERIWLTSALMEEAKELDVSENLVDQVDALIDTIVFAMGGLARLGLTPDQAEKCFHAVMDANFEKRKGQKASRAIGGVADAIKPEGWVGPETRIASILKVAL